MTTKPFTLKGGPVKPGACCASRCPDADIIRYAENTTIGRHFHKRYVALCERHHKLFWRCHESTQPVLSPTPS